MDCELLSIIIPIYNSEDYLERCLDSVINQTYRELDIILIDDGSSDNSGLIAKDYEKKDARIRVFSQENKGLIATRKRGVELAKGKIIGFVDSDDWVDKDMFEKLIRCMINNGCDLVSSGIIHDYEDSESDEVYDIYSQGLYKKLEEEIFPSMLYDFRKKEMGLKCTLVNKLYRKRLLQDVYCNIDTRIFYGEDALTIYQYCLKCSNIYILKEAKYHYCIREKSMCRDANENLTLNTYYLYKGLKDSFLNSSVPLILLKQLRHYILQLESHTLKMLFDIDTLVYANWDFSGYDEVIGKKVVIYGAGACGQAFYRKLVSTGNQQAVVAWVDKSSNNKKEKCLENILPIDEILHLNYDYIVIAIKNESVAMKVKEELIKKYSIRPEKIFWRLSSYEELVPF